MEVVMLVLRVWCGGGCVGWWVDGAYIMIEFRKIEQGQKWKPRSGSKPTIELWIANKGGNLNIMGLAIFKSIKIINIFALSKIVSLDKDS